MGLVHRVVGVGVAAGLTRACLEAEALAQCEDDRVDMPWG